MVFLGMPRSRPARKGVGLVHILIVLAAIALIWIVHEPALSSVGTFLNTGEAPRKSDAIVVLAGGWRGERILLAADLKEKGYAPLVIVSGATKLYGQSECPMAIGMIAKMGRPTSGYLCADSLAESTSDEAAAVVRFLKSRGLSKVMVVSVDTHMRRAARLWRNAGKDLDLNFVAAPSPHFDLKRWYTTREGLKAITLEYTKVITSYFGI